LKASEHNESVDREFIEQLAMTNQLPIAPTTTTPTPQTPIVVNNNNFNININLTPSGVRSVEETKKTVGSFLRAMLNLRPGDMLMLGIDDSQPATNDVLTIQSNYNSNTITNHNSLNQE
jgi:hypothetical protein